MSSSRGDDALSSLLSSSCQCCQVGVLLGALLLGLWWKFWALWGILMHFFFLNLGLFLQTCACLQCAMFELSNTWQRCLSSGAAQGGGKAGRKKEKEIGGGGRWPREKQVSLQNNNSNKQRGRSAGGLLQGEVRGRLEGEKRGRFRSPFSPPPPLFLLHGGGAVIQTLFFLLCHQSRRRRLVIRAALPSAPPRSELPF